MCCLREGLNQRLVDADSFKYYQHQMNFLALGERVGREGGERGWGGRVGRGESKIVFLSLRSARRVQSTWWRSTRDSDRGIALVGQLAWQHIVQWEM